MQKTAILIKSNLVLKKIKFMLFVSQDILTKPPVIHVCSYMSSKIIVTLIYIYI